MRVAFLGLGVMGGPMARHLAAAGHDIVVWNRTVARADAFAAAHGGTVAASPAAAARDAGAVFTCVGNDDDLRSVVLGPDGVFAGLPAGALFIDHTTVSAVIARALAAARPDCHVIDAPVSGGQAGAENAALTIMCGGSADGFAAAEPLLAAYGRRVRHIGPAGCGQLAKMVNQIAIAGVVQGLAEALHFADRAGLDAAAVVDVIGSGAAQSWQMDNRAATMIAGQFDFGFAVDWMRKDLALVLAEARRNGARLPLAALVDQFYADVQAAGGGRNDTSSLIRRLT
jgi:3-hydroxyisobutyrate dehydrogenase